ncbi:MAG: hypothetical protein HY671_11645 [Chloroflexi bacterium]|nr:hypothetical protein [Chloroflexota bacterium]
MLRKKKDNRKVATERFGEILRTFGDTMGEILEDPEVKKKAKELAQTAVDAAAKVVESKIKDAEVRKRFSSVGKAVKTLGKSLEDNFASEEGSPKKA